MIDPDDIDSKPDDEEEGEEQLREEEAHHYTAYASAFMDEPEEELRCEMAVEQVLLGALGVDGSERKSLTAKTALSRASTSSSLPQEMGDMLTTTSFYDENDESQETTLDDGMKLRQAQNKGLMQVMLARLLHNISKGNLASKKKRRKNKGR